MNVKSSVIFVLLPLLLVLSLLSNARNIHAQDVGQRQQINTLRSTVEALSYSA